jgi:hypothetical protein
MADSNRRRPCLPDKIKGVVADHNAHPKPFMWVKSVDKIIDSIARSALRISRTGH